MSPELTIFSIIALLIRAYTGFDAVAERTSKYSIIRVKKFPIYGEKKPADVAFMFPYGRISVGSVIKINVPYNSADVLIMSSTGESYRHPHIFNGGTPCWNGGTVTNLTSLFEMMVMTLLWTNVTEDSREIGHYTSCKCTQMMAGNYQHEISEHKKRIQRAVKKNDETPGQFFIKRFPALVENALAVHR